MQTCRKRSVQARQPRKNETILGVPEVYVSSICHHHPNFQNVEATRITMKKLNLNEYVILTLYGSDPAIEYAAVDAYRRLSDLINRNTLHSQLGELWSNGCLSRRAERNPPRDRPPKQLYRITTQGTARLRELDGHWRQFDAYLLSLRVFHGSNSSAVSMPLASV